GPGCVLERRAGAFRRDLLPPARAAARALITYETCAGGGSDPLMARLLDLERRSWKGPAGEGLLIPSMEAFYRALVRRLLPRGRLRARLARRQGEDIGYILGGVRAGIYRGLQFSYDERFARHSLGHWMQWMQVQEACGEGLALYDLGGAMEYKQAWGECPLDTATLEVWRTPGRL
ncbi:MAG: GNAT family N-acetyltransferase, partial [Planctomycetaceae bacterium]